MAIIDDKWSWWYAGFWVNLLLPISVDVANLLITDIFPKETQALAGAVYQTMSQLGISIGIAILAVVSNAVTNDSSLPDKWSPEAQLQGYRPVFWTCFGLTVSSTLVGLWGLRGCNTVESSTEQLNNVASSTKQPKPPIENGVPGSWVITRKPLPPTSIPKTKPTGRIVRRNSMTSIRRNKPLPKLPSWREQPSSIRLFTSEEVVPAPGSDAGLIQDYFSEHSNKSQASLSVEYNIIDEYLVMRKHTTSPV
ncbi:hypothetical protein ACLMJK_004282 [Lecanora helva]